MSVGRRCRRCGARAVHRAQRRSWQRWSAWLVPLRPLHCIECNAKSWGLLYADEGRARYAVAAVAWLLILVAVLRTAGDPPPSRLPTARAPTVPRVAPPPPTDVQTAAAAPTLIAASPAAAPVLTAAATPPAPTSVPAADAAAREMRLDAIDVRWTGEAMEVVVRGDGELVHELRADGNVQGYVLDLPGRWQLPPTLRMSRSFSRSNLQRLRIGRHDGFLRIVFSLRDPARPPPTVEPIDDGLRVQVR